MQEQPPKKKIKNVTFVTSTLEGHSQQEQETMEAETGALHQYSRSISQNSSEKSRCGGQSWPNK